MGAADVVGTSGPLELISHTGPRFTHAFSLPKLIDPWYERWLRSIKLPHYRRRSSQRASTKDVGLADGAPHIRCPGCARNDNGGSLWNRICISEWRPGFELIGGRRRRRHTDEGDWRGQYQRSRFLCGGGIEFYRSLSA